MGRRVGVAVGAVVAAGLLFLLAMDLWLGTLVQTAIVQAASRVTKTPVTLENVRIGLMRGLVQLEGLEIGNPPGFTSKNAVRLGTVRVRLDLRSVLSDTVIIDEILVEAPDITFEGLPTSNLSVLQSNVAAAMPAGSEKPAEPKPAASGSKKLLIKKFSLTNGRVITNITGRRLPLNISNIHLTDIGKETGGATPEQVVSAVVSAMARSATDTVTDQAKEAGETANRAAELRKSLLK